MLDNYDSFTFNLVQLLGIMGAQCDVVPNDASELPRTADQLQGYAGLVISPGPGAPSDAGQCLAVIELAERRLPILGVCLGHQAIAQHFGASVTRAQAPIHGKATPIRHDGKGLFRDVPNPLQAARYHSLIVARHTLPSCLEPTAFSEHGELMGLRHRNLPIEGIQFHPESILSQSSTLLMQNWLESLPR